MDYVYIVWEAYGDGMTGYDLKRISGIYRTQADAHKAATSLNQSRNYDRSIGISWIVRKEALQ